MAPLISHLNRKHEPRLRTMIVFCKSTYASDYFGLLVLLIIYVVAEFWVDPFHRMFFIDDINISFPHAETERVPALMNFVYALFIPLVIIALYNTFTGASIHKHHVTILGISIALLLASALTDIVKNMVGRPRPDLLARCKPPIDTPLSTLVSHTICTETDRHKLQDGWRSFPSGHSSFAFAGLGYLSLFLSGQLKVFVLRNSDSIRPTTVGERLDGSEREFHVRGDLGRALICLTPILGATVIAITRCQDYRHDVYDVCVGSFLGWSIAYWSYRRYWPRLDTIHCDKPYTAPECSSTEFGGYGHVRDEEEGHRDVGVSTRS